MLILFYSAWLDMHSVIFANFLRLHIADEKLDGYIHIQNNTQIKSVTFWKSLMFSPLKK